MNDYDVIVVGAGFGGLYAVHRLREQGWRVHGIEAGSGVGGTWFFNRYPGARCDIESTEYSYSFSEELQQDWEWTQRYPTQPEILRYLNHVCDRFALRNLFSFDTTVVGARYRDSAASWTLTTATGEQLTASMVVMATGSLSVPRIPDFPGLADFAGTVLHTADWPAEPVDFSGERVAVIGTGSSGIQVIPNIAATASELTVFQRTANFSISGPNAYLSPTEIAEVKANYPALREHARRSFGGSTIPINRQSALEVTPVERDEQFERRWRLGGFAFLAAYSDLGIDPDANALAADFVRRKIASIVTDPAVAELLTPRDHPIGAKRICVDTGYYETFNRPGVRLVDVSDSPITRITEHGLRVGSTQYEFDRLVLATGFDAMTGALNRIDIIGRDELSWRDAWADGPVTYLGLMTAGFPNLFVVAGPGSPSVLSNVVLAVEQHVDWIADCLNHLRQHGLNCIEATADAQADWVDHVNEVAGRTLYTRAASWYLGANVPGKPRVFMPYAGGVGRYRKKCAAVAAAGYSGFVLGFTAAPLATSSTTSAGL